MLAFACLPDPVLHALTTRALTELHRVITYPEAWSALDYGYWDEDLMGLRLLYTDSAIKKASTILLKAHRDPATLWDLDSRHWLHLLTALEVAAQAHEPLTRLGPSQVECIDFQSLRRCIPRKRLFCPADIPGELLRSHRETENLSLTSLGPPSAAYIERLCMPMPARIALYPDIPEPFLGPCRHKGHQ